MSSPQGLYVREGVMFSEKPDIETKKCDEMYTCMWSAKQQEENTCYWVTVQRDLM